MDGLNNTIDFICRLYEIVVILQANNDATLLPHLHTGLDIVQQPFCYLSFCVSFGIWSAGENPDDRGTQFGSDFNPFFDMIHLPLPFGFIGDRKIIPNPRTTDLQTKTECFSFYMKKIIIRWYEGITFKIITGNIHTFETCFGTE